MVRILLLAALCLLLTAVGCNRLSGGADANNVQNTNGNPNNKPVNSPPPGSSPTPAPTGTATPAPTPTPTPTPPGNHKRVFVTSTTYTGFLGGVSSADSICQARANAGSLGGTWIAWISDGSVSAGNRVTDVSPWYLIDNSTLVFSSKSAITSGGPQHAIDLTELKGAPSVTNVWTGTAASGAASGNNCQNWSSSSSKVTGDMGSTTTGNAWTQNGFLTCSLGAALYCIEQ